MKTTDRDIIGEIIFWATLAFALLLYLVLTPSELRTSVAREFSQ